MRSGSRPDTPEPNLSYLFKHATTQEVAYASLPFALRAQLHEQLAAWLEQQADEAAPLDLLAYHYGRSANAAKQRKYFTASANAETGPPPVDFSKPGAKKP